MRLRREMDGGSREMLAEPDLRGSLELRAKIVDNDNYVYAIVNCIREFAHAAV
jgi:hypothetical protein